MFNGFKFAFFGTPEFAKIILKKLIDSNVVPDIVICNPDKPFGRKKIITPPPVKQLIANCKLQIEILQPENLSAICHKLSAISPELFIVASYAKIIPKEILEIPRLGAIGVHPSLLPKYRGASPIQSAILNGDEETGTTLLLMDEKVDHGPIISRRKLEFPISNFQFPILLNKLAELSADLLIETLPNIEDKIKNAKPQDESLATYTKKFKTEDGYIEPEDLEKAQKEDKEIAIKIYRKISALNPKPGVWTIKDSKRIKLLESKIQNDLLKITKIQIEGKTPIEISSII